MNWFRRLKGTLYGAHTDCLKKHFPIQGQLGEEYVQRAFYQLLGNSTP